MKPFSVVPFLGMGPFNLGDERITVRKIGGKFDAFVSNVDAFDELGFHCHYDSTDHVEFIEAFEPSVPKIDGVPVLGRSLSDIISELKLHGLHLDQPLTDSIFPVDGFAFTLVEDRRVEAVAVFRKGYYDRLSQ